VCKIILLEPVEGIVSTACLKHLTIIIT
jgi:hypothetical protein